MRWKAGSEALPDRRWPWHPPAAALCAILIAGPLAGQAPAEYEEPPTLSAEAVLPPELLEGPHHRVSEEVENDGYLNIYTIESELGVFTAVGEDVLRERIREIEALAALAEVTKSEAFAKAVGAAAMAPVKTAKNVVASPVATVKGLPSGVGRYFQRASRKAKKAGKQAGETLGGDRDEGEEGDETEEPGTEDEGEEGEGSEGEDAEEEGGGTLAKTRAATTDVTKRYLGVGRTKREWAKKLGVDPYSTNEVLQAELDRVAGAASVGSFGARLATPDLGAIDYLGEANDLVWNMSATDLEVLNAKRLREMGLEKAEIEALFQNPVYTPTRLTGLVAALDGLTDVPGRDQLVRLAGAATTEEEAFYYQRGAEGLRVYHSEVAPVQRIATGPVWAGGVTADGTFVLTLALDYVVLTESAATGFRLATDIYSGQAGVERYAVYLTGRVSPRVREELENLGWRVEEGMRERWIHQDTP